MDLVIFVEWLGILLDLVMLGNIVFEHGMCEGRAEEADFTI